MPLFTLHFRYHKTEVVKTAQHISQADQYKRTQNIKAHEKPAEWKSQKYSLVITMITRHAKRLKILNISST